MSSRPLFVRSLCLLLALLPCARAVAQPSSAPASAFVAFEPRADFALPPIVVQHDPATGTGHDFESLDKLPLYQMLTAGQPNVVLSVRHLREAVRQMTGKTLPVVSGKDLSRGIVLTTLAGAPADVKNDPEVREALRDTDEDAYNANEAFYIRSEPQRVLIVTNTTEGFPVAVVELLDSVEYEVLGMGPNWTHVPDHTGKPLAFSIKRAGRAKGFYIRQLHGASGAPGGIGTIFQKKLSDPADEPVEVSYYQRWLIGARLASKSMPYFPGHALWQYHWDVLKKMKETRSTAGFLRVVKIGPAATRPPASAENERQLWVDEEDAGGKPGEMSVYYSDGKQWIPATSAPVPSGVIDPSVPFVREIVLEHMKRKAQAHFEQSPDEVFVFGTDPEDGDGYFNFAERLHDKNWYPDYLKAEGVEFPRPYVLHGFKGLDQPTETWDHTAPADTVFGFSNWLLREFDQWVDSLPEDQRVTKTGKSKKELTRASLYSYNAHDVPPNFNLDPRIRVMIAGFPKHRGMGKWKNFATPIDMGQAFKRMLPREPSGDYWILSVAMYYDMTTARIEQYSKRPSTLRKRVRELYDAGFRAVSAEMDFNFGRLGLDYYLYAKLLWDPHMSDDELVALRDRWLTRSFGGGWEEMRRYYDFMAPEANVVNGPNKWAKAIRMIEAADAKIDAAKEPMAQRRIDDLKQYWYFYYLVESGQATSDSREMREFMWKGQMSYMTPMHMVAGNVFKTEDAATAAGAEFNTGPAHYSAEETRAWWAKVLAFWPVITVADFSDATLADGRKGKNVDVNDLVAVREFRGEKPTDQYFYYDALGYPASILTVASKAGEEIGFKLTWPFIPGDSAYAAKDVAYSVARWDPAAKRWEDLVDMSMTKVPSRAVDNKFIDTDKYPQIHAVEVRFAAPSPDTYRIDLGTGGTLAKLGSLAFDVPTVTYDGARPFSFSTAAVGYTQSPAFFYIPKGTKSLDFEIWGPPAKKVLQFYTGLPGAGGMTLARQVTFDKPGTQRVPLKAGEDGTIASIGGDMFNMPQLYSVPMLWSKSPDALLVPRDVAKADGLTVETPAP